MWRWITLGVRFTEPLREKADFFFVKEDPTRIYRGLKDLLVDEFDMDRVIEGHMEFNMKKPKDRLRMYAIKEKSPYTVIFYEISFKGKRPRDLYKYDRDDDILKSRVKTEGKIITDYPGGNMIQWLPRQLKLDPDEQIEFTGFEREKERQFHNSKLYEIFVGIWYKKFYQKEITRYQEEARETMVRIHNLMRERYGVEKSIERTGASQYKPPWE